MKKQRTMISIDNLVFGVFGHILWAIRNLIIPLDRAHRILLETRIGALEQIPGRIWAGFTRI